MSLSERISGLISEFNSIINEIADAIDETPIKVSVNLEHDSDIGLAMDVATVMESAVDSLEYIQENIEPTMSFINGKKKPDVSTKTDLPFADSAINGTAAYSVTNQLVDRLVTEITALKTRMERAEHALVKLGSCEIVLDDKTCRNCMKTMWTMNRIHGDEKFCTNCYMETIVSNNAETDLSNTDSLSAGTGPTWNERVNGVIHADTVDNTQRTLDSYKKIESDDYNNYIKSASASVRERYQLGDDVPALVPDEMLAMNSNGIELSDGVVRCIMSNSLFDHSMQDSNVAGHRARADVDSIMSEHENEQEYLLNRMAEARKRCREQPAPASTSGWLRGENGTLL